MAWALKNPKHEKFCQAVAEGKTNVQAYVIAGYKENIGNASTFACRPEIKERVNQIRVEGAAAAQVSVRRVVTELARVAFADITEAMEIIDGKVRIKDTAQWSTNLRAAVAEISDGREGVRVKFHSKPQAIETLARHLAMFKDNVDLNVNVSLADLVNGSYRLERDELQIRDGRMIDVTANKELSPAPNKSSPDRINTNEASRPNNAHKPDSGQNGREQGQ
jgi:phage terminase small subunit